MTESFLGDALAGLREQVVLVSKVYPQNAGRGRLERACEASLTRLQTDMLDVYLLHWRGAVPLAETVEGMEALKPGGQDPRWGRQQPGPAGHGRAGRRGRLGVRYGIRSSTTSRDAALSSISCRRSMSAACR